LTITPFKITKDWRIGSTHWELDSTE